jgi:hypothetical protein
MVASSQPIVPHTRDGPAEQRSVRAVTKYITPAPGPELVAARRAILGPTWRLRRRSRYRRICRRRHATGSIGILRRIGIGHDGARRRCGRWIGGLPINRRHRRGPTGRVPERRGNRVSRCRRIRQINLRRDAWRAGARPGRWWPRRAARARRDRSPHRPAQSGGAPR